MKLRSKNLSITIGFNGKTIDALSLKCKMKFNDSRALNMIEVKPVEINYLLGRE